MELYGEELEIELPTLTDPISHKEKVEPSIPQSISSPLGETTEKKKVSKKIDRKSLPPPTEGIKLTTETGNTNDPRRRYKCKHINAEGEMCNKNAKHIYCSTHIILKCHYDELKSMDLGHFYEKKSKYAKDKLKSRISQETNLKE